MPFRRYFGSSAEVGRFGSTLGMAPKAKRSGKSGWKAFNKKRSEARTLARQQRSGEGPQPIANGESQPSANVESEPSANVELKPIANGSPQQVADAGSQPKPAQVASAHPTRKPHTATEATASAEAEPLGDGRSQPHGLGDGESQPRGSPPVTSRHRDACVGEHVSGEPFLWRGIFDLPP